MEAAARLTRARMRAVARLASRRLLHVDRHLFDLAGEAALQARHVVLGDRRIVVLANIGTFVGRDDVRDGLRDAPFGYVLPVDGKRSRTAPAEAVTVI